LNNPTCFFLLLLLLPELPGHQRGQHAVKGGHAVSGELKRERERERERERREKSELDFQRKSARKREKKK
jgi:hypothetical protein